MDKSELALGTTTFAQLRAAGQVYVDKTECLYWLTLFDRPQCLIRPLHMGLGLLVSTCEELFLHGVEPYDGHDSYFKGLAIEQQWQDHGGYPVLHLNFAQLSVGCATCAELRAKLYSQLGAFCHDHQLTLTDDPNDIIELFTGIIQQLPHRTLVLLVEAYDAPQLHFLSNESELKAYQLMMSGLLCWVKNKWGRCRFILFTGMTRYQSINCWFAGDLEDITHDHHMATCCGFTRAELQQYFAEHLRQAAASRLGCAPDAVTAAQIEELLDELAAHYGGYNFSDRAQDQLYAPQPVLQFLSAPQAQLQPYGRTEAKMHQFIAETLVRRGVIDLIEDVANSHFFVGRSTFMMTSPVYPELHPYALMYQAGYLTLKIFDRRYGIQLMWPNQEARRICTDLIGSCLFQHREFYTQELRQRTLEAFTGGDTTALCRSLNTFFAALSYEQYPIQNPYMVAAAIHAHLRLLGFTPYLDPDPGYFVMRPHMMKEGLDRTPAIGTIELPKQQLKLVLVYQYAQSEAKLAAHVAEAQKTLSDSPAECNSPRFAQELYLAVVYSAPQRKLACVTLLDAPNAPAEPTAMA